MLVDPSSLGPIQRGIYDTLIQNVVNKMFTSAVGTIISVNLYTWTANIELIDPISGERVRHDDVPMPLAARGVKMQPLKPGDIVFVGFAQGKFHAPYIIAYVPREYITSTTDSSAVNPDILNIL